MNTKSSVTPLVLDAVRSVEVRMDAIKAALALRGWCVAPKFWVNDAMRKGGRIAVLRAIADGENGEIVRVDVCSEGDDGVALIGSISDAGIERPAAIADLINNTMASRVLSCAERAAYLCGRGIGC